MKQINGSAAYSLKLIRSSSGRREIETYGHNPIYRHFGNEGVDERNRTPRNHVADDVESGAELAIISRGVTLLDGEVLSGSMKEAAANICPDIVKEAVPGQKCCELSLDTRPTMNDLRV